ncbi:hypothetical protein CEXT_376471 [Caerostris extrusa]|uniref:Uncharacterized protein n=1 Tax=Caerostris extrusa TaxID=172846 RepID=A0AAV4MF74_CAEEX|nr:hypothetical protein CEXT_376471 [Caerostris extrusa]
MWFRLNVNPDRTLTVSALIARDGDIYFRATDISKLLGYKSGSYFAKSISIHKIRVLTEGRGKWEFKRLLFKTSPCKAPKNLVQDSGEWVPQLLSVFRQKVTRYFYGVHYGGGGSQGQDVVVEPDDADEKFTIMIQSCLRHYDLLVENEEIVKTSQATLPTGTRTHEETAPPTGAQNYEEITPPTAAQNYEEIT